MSYQNNTFERLNYQVVPHKILINNQQTMNPPPNNKINDNPKTPKHDPSAPNTNQTHTIGQVLTTQKQNAQHLTLQKKNRDLLSVEVPTHSKWRLLVDSGTHSLGATTLTLPGLRCLCFISTTRGNISQCPKLIRKLSRLYSVKHTRLPLTNTVSVTTTRRWILCPVTTLIRGEVCISFFSMIQM